MRLEGFLISQFNSTIGLVRESPDDSINRTYWLLSDNLLASHALKPYHPDIAAQINETLMRFGVFKDGLHEALFGGIIEVPPYTPKETILQKIDSWEIKAELRDKNGKLMNDWIEYADILIYASLSEHNRGNDGMATYYFNRAKEMWNGAGLYDKPTVEDGWYTTQKMALLFYVSKVLNQTLPFRADLEERIWTFQREDGGIRSHYLGNLTSTREANTETASLVLLAYDYGFESTSELLQSYDMTPFVSSERSFWSSDAQSLLYQSLKEYELAKENFNQRDFESASAQARTAIALQAQAETVENEFRQACTLLAILLIIGISAIATLWYATRKRSGSNASHS
jgi:hypothetical protein